MILVLGGTTEGRQLVEKLSKKRVPVLVSTAYDFAGRFMPHSDNIEHISGTMGSEAIRALINTNGVRIVVDASHPYAQEISSNARAACEACNIKYIRLERPSSGTVSYDKAYYVDTMDEAATLARKLGKNIFLTTGKNNANLFKQRLCDDEIKLYIRILPEEMSVQACKQAGFQEDEIIRGYGPYSYKENVELWQKLNVDLVISKDSGVEGGFPEKLQAVKDLSIAIIIIARPPMIEEVECGHQNVDEVLDALKCYR